MFFNSVSEIFKVSSNTPEAIGKANANLYTKAATIVAAQHHKKERSSDDRRGSRPKFIEMSAEKFASKP